MSKKPLKIVYLTPALYMAGGVERVLTLKASYLAERLGYDVTIVVTEGEGKPLFYPLSGKVAVVHLAIGFERLWSCTFFEKIPVYLVKQWRYRRRLTRLLCELKPDVTVSLLRREINFLCDIKDGSKKVGELHVNRANYRNFEANDTNLVKRLFARYWMHSLVSHLKRLDRFVVLTEEDRASWTELGRVDVIPDPLSFEPTRQSRQTIKRVVAVGRYVYQKGFDLLLRAWAKVEGKMPEWELCIYGDGDRTPYEQLRQELGLDEGRCHLNGKTQDVEQVYAESSLFVFSSRFEGFGMVLVEAMSCGLPVVSFDCPCGPKDIVSDGEDGLLIEHGHADKLADGLLRLMSDDGLRRQMAVAARVHASRYRLERIGEKWQKLFEEVTER